MSYYSIPGGVAGLAAGLGLIAVMGVVAYGAWFWWNVFANPG